MELVLGSAQRSLEYDPPMLSRTHGYTGIRQVSFFLSATAQRFSFMHRCFAASCGSPNPACSCQAPDLSFSLTGPSTGYTNYDENLELSEAASEAQNTAPEHEACRCSSRVSTGALGSCSSLKYFFQLRPLICASREPEVPLCD